MWTRQATLHLIVCATSSLKHAGQYALGAFHYHCWLFGYCHYDPGRPLVKQRHRDKRESKFSTVDDGQYYLCDVLRKIFVKTSNCYLTLGGITASK
jgi:hypothetical protein